MHTQHWHIESQANTDWCTGTNGQCSNSRGFTTPPSAMDRPSRQKINKKTLVLNHPLEKFYKLKKIEIRSTIFSFFFNLTQGHAYWFLEKVEGRERAGEKHPCRRETSVGYLLYTPQLGPNSQPGYVPQPEITPTTLQFKGWCSNKLSHTGQVLIASFKK